MVGATGASVGFDAAGSDGDDSADGDGDASGEGDGDASGVGDGDTSGVGDGDSSGDGDGADDSGGDAADLVNGVTDSEFTTAGASVGILTADALGVPAGCCNAADFSEAASCGRVPALLASFRSNPSRDPLIF